MKRLQVIRLFYFTLRIFIYFKRKLQRDCTTAIAAFFGSIKFLSFLIFWVMFYTPDNPGLLKIFFHHPS